jgi:hypothetical protein
MVNLVQQAMHGTSIIPSKYDGKSDENMTKILTFFWLGFQIFV